MAGSFVMTAEERQEFLAGVHVGVIAIAEEGRSLHSSWDEERFLEVAMASGSYLDGKAWPDVLDAYLRLLREAVGRDLVANCVQPEWHKYFRERTRWRSLLELLLLLELPLQLTEIPREEQLATMTRVWNLGIGALEDRPWMDPYLRARVEVLDLRGQPRGALRGRA